MSKRITSERVKKWAIGSGIGSGVSLAVLMIWFMVSLGSIEITSYSGDSVCAGTEKDPCIVTIKIKGGKQFSQRNDGPVKGDPRNPLSQEDIGTKFDRITTPILGQERASQVISTISQLDRLDDVSKLVDLLTA